MNARTLLVRGMLVGIAAGLLAYLFASAFGEGSVNAAIGFEGAHTAAGAAEPEMISRTVQSTLGLAVAVVVYGAALGGIFGLACAFGYGRLGRLGGRGTSLLIAGMGFVAVELVPFLKYPANPPAIGHPETITRRTVLYFSMIGISVLATALAALLARTLHTRLGTWDAVLAGVALFVAVATLAALLLPVVNEVPGDFPADVLWRFRVASLGTQLTLWTTLGLGYGALTERSLRTARSAPRLTPVG